MRSDDNRGISKGADFCFADFRLLEASATPSRTNVAPSACCLLTCQSVGACCKRKQHTALPSGATLQRWSLVQMGHGLLLVTSGQLPFVVTAADMVRWSILTFLGQWPVRPARR